MKRYLRYILVFALLWVTGFAEVSAQNDRAFIREGNRAYRSRKWAAAETQYRKAISKNGKNPQAVYNLGCALMMQQKDSVAMQQFANSAQLEPNKLRRAKSYHNMGVIMQNHREYAQAIDCYKNALRCNPTDNETRYNLALCKKLLKNQQNKNQQNKNKNNKNKDKNKDKDKQNKDKNKDNKNNQDKDKNKNNQNQNQQNNQDKMSRDNAEQLLNAAVQQEQATKRKLQKAMSQPRRKQYEKNW
ncbi:MAG TPA: aerotolerance regulator BatC [Prevotella sp.]|nr:aerotolerance regulator BatC [Candidatus Segatella violae]